MMGNEVRPARLMRDGVQVHNPALQSVDYGMWQQETHFFVEELK